MNNPCAGILIVCALALVAMPVEAGENSFRGHFRCGLNNYTWPLSPDSPPTPGGTGVIEIDSDGNGKFTAGTMTQHLADDTHFGGENVCTFRLASGEYHMSSVNAGTSSIAWTLQQGSDNHCGAYTRNLMLLGFQASARDYRPFSTTSNFFLLDDGSSKWVGASLLGVSIGACAPTH